jgi:hypothetical protein
MARFNEPIILLRRLQPCLRFNPLFIFTQLYAQTGDFLALGRICVMSGVCRPSGALQVFGNGFPPLPWWATVCRPSGILCEGGEESVALLSNIPSGG